MSCPHPERAVETQSRQINEDTRQVEYICRSCNQVISCELEEVRQW